MVVLCLDKGVTEDAVDRQFIEIAQNLGITVACTTPTTLDSVATGLP